MPERLYLTFDNHYAVPPEYAMAWLLDFRPEDMKAMAGEKAPLIRVTGLPDGRLQREFSLPMGMGDMVTRTTAGRDEWIALCELRDKRGRLTTTNRIVESVRPDSGGTRHHVDLYQDDLTTKSKVLGALFRPVQRAQIRKLFAVNKRAMEEAFRAGKPPTA